jgi:hypothetical protein
MLHHLLDVVDKILLNELRNSDKKEGVLIAGNRRPSEKKICPSATLSEPEVK